MLHMRLFLNPSVSYTLLGIYSPLCLISLAYSKIPDTHVTCIYSEDCILPCSFLPSAEDVVIRWYKQGTLIYTFLEDEDEADDGNVSVFTDEVAQGNASLLLQDSDIKSRGRYKCVVNTTEAVQESFVIVRVEALISSVAIEATPTAHVQCSSSGVYPAPVLQWSTEPDFAPDSLRPTTRMGADSKQLFRVESSVRKINTSVDVTYICSLSSKYNSQTWKASLLQTELTGVDGQDLVIPCQALKNLHSFTLTWTFTRPNSRSHVLTYHSKTRKTINDWDGEAELDQDRAHMGDGSLHLKNLDSEHSGTYTCVFMDSQVNQTVQTAVRIRDSSSIAQTDNSQSGLWVLTVVVAVLILLCVFLFICWKYRGKSKHSDQDQQQDTEMQAVHKANPGENLPTENCPLSQNNTEDLQ
ncbi:V-set domain-containing T-cell activation inhibitor 1 [Trichomycterus rosablanca]|uniref:V-set domain-containing T-cell activation inhibitor 1 n=1 Tax=Trichomycterus rosablanca TaxID=2290929 RepID=UPI002F35703B